jgi:flagellar basal-body rod protein FlgF
MLKGLYDASAGMRARLAVQDIIASNLANAGTDGFQRQLVAIRGRRLPDSATPARIQALYGSLGDDMMPIATPRDILEPFSSPDSRSGVLQHTGSRSDVALDGNGYLVVQSPAGNRLIRGGSLQVNAQGLLATTAGDLLLSTEGRPISVAGKSWQVGPDGTVSDADGGVLGRLRIVRPNGPVRSEGARLASAGALQDVSGADVQVRQGYLEHSNVEPVKEMVDMIAGVRAYEASQRAVLAQDQSLQNLLEVMRR